MTGTDLNQLTRDVIASSTIADPREMAAEIFRRIPAEDYGPLLLELLPGKVREMYRATRNGHVPAPEPVKTAPQPETKQPVNRSAKVTGIREMGKQKLRDRVFTGPKAWKLLGDCGFDDLMYAATERREHAASVDAKATWYAALAELLRTSGVDRVRDLPDETLRERLTGQAA